MKIFPLGICLIVLSSLPLGGCAFMNEEDRDFYGRGWVKPTDLDKEAPRHIYTDPTQSTTTARPASQSQSDPAWLVPETTEHPR